MRLGWVAVLAGRCGPGKNGARFAADADPVVGCGRRHGWRVRARLQVERGEGDAVGRDRVVFGLGRCIAAKLAADPRCGGAGSGKVRAGAGGAERKQGDHYSVIRRRFWAGRFTPRRVEISTSWDGGGWPPGGGYALPRSPCWEARFGVFFAAPAPIGGPVDHDAIGRAGNPDSGAAVMQGRGPGTVSAKTRRFWPALAQPARESRGGVAGGASGRW